MTDPMGCPVDPLRLRLDLSYDGTDFAGWAVQPGRRTVAGTLGEALATLFRAPVPLVVAGRTDAGVHATGQVAHIDVDPTRLAELAPRHRRGGSAPAVPTGLDGLLRRLAGLLPPDVRVREVTAAPVGFDARFAALRRHYCYRIGTAAWGVPPADRGAVLGLLHPLDVDRMSLAASALVGLHDFAAYCRPREGATTVRHLQRLEVVRAERDADEVRVQVTADAFCHSMVRSLVGVLIRVGEGRAPLDAPARLLAARARTSEVATAPARGLTLVGVDYPPDDELVTRVETTRAIRDTPG